MNKLMIVIMALMMFGCASAGKMNRISLGMNKDQVIDKLGDPNSTKAGDGVEVLSYMLTATDNDAIAYHYTEYWVVLKDNKCVQYGKAGDFGSGVNSTNKLILETRTPASK